jgi:hypothetical protein
MFLCRIGMDATLQRGHRSAAGAAPEATCPRAAQSERARADVPPLQESRSRMSLEQIAAADIATERAAGVAGRSHDHSRAGVPSGQKAAGSPTCRSATMPSSARSSAALPRPGRRAEGGPGVAKTPGPYFPIMYLFLAPRRTRCLTSDRGIRKGTRSSAFSQFPARLSSS